jgi:hypothetical protein
MADVTGFSEVKSLDAATVNGFVTKRKAGVYVLDGSASGPFNVDYVGRSDDDVAGRLLFWVGSYRYFRAVYCSSAKEAFELECTVYHSLNPINNKAHPARPAGTNYPCPVAKCKVLV